MFKVFSFIDFVFKVLNPHRLAAETGAGERGWVVMLSEHPNVRVHGDPAIHVPGEGMPTLGRDAKRRGALSWGYTILWARKEGVRKNLLKAAIPQSLASSE